MDNMIYYNKFSDVPQEAQKPITAGRLKGMTDINPMWRIKKLTEEFGPAGIGWYYEITDKRIDEGADGVQVVTVIINLYVKVDGEWSKPIQGIGGSNFTAKEIKGLYTSDEAFKMALTDAISISCKALGMAASIYFAKDRSKYDAEGTTEDAPEEMSQKEKQILTLRKMAKDTNTDEGEVLAAYEVSSYEDMTDAQRMNCYRTLKTKLGFVNESKS